MSKADWVMIRVPRELKDQLEAYGLTIQDYEPKQQGNHEDNKAYGPPLWRVVQRLLGLELAHKKRSRSNSDRQAAEILRESDRLVNIARQQSDAKG